MKREKSRWKNKLYIFIVIEILLISVFAMLLSSTEAKEVAKEKLQEVVDDSYIEPNKVDVSILKSNIENNLNNAKVVDESKEKFPVETVVDGYKFAVVENGEIRETEETVSEEEKVENITNEIQENTLKEENTNVPNEDIGNITDIEKKDESIVGENEKPVQEERSSLVKYKNDEKSRYGVTVTTTEEGVITVKGKANNMMFIKISNGIEFVSKIENDFIKWVENDGIIIEKGTKISEKVDIMDNYSSGGQVNVVLRNRNNEATGIIKLADGETEYKDILKEDIVANYVYIDSGVNVGNVQFKVGIFKEEDTKEEKKPNKIEDLIVSEGQNVEL